MSKFKVGDTVRRIKDEHCGMQVGDIGVVESITAHAGIVITGYAYSSTTRGSHSEDNFELVTCPVSETCTGRIHNKESEMKDEVQEAREHLARVEAALAAKTAKETFTAEINRKIRLAAAIVQALSDVRGLENNEPVTTIVRKEYAEFKSELCATLKEYGYKIVYVGDKSKATVVQC